MGWTEGRERNRLAVPPAPSHKPQRAVHTIAWITAVCLLGDSMLYIVLPVYWKLFGLQSVWEVGFLLSINRFVRLPLNPLIGWLYSRIPKRTGVVIAVGLALLTTLAYGSLSGFTALLVARALWGAAWSLLRIGGYLTILEASNTSNRGILLGTYNGILGIGSLVGMLAGGVLAELIHVRYVAWILGAAIVIGLPLAWRYVPGHSVSGEEKSREVCDPADMNTHTPREEAKYSKLAASLNFSAKGWLVLLSGLTTGVIFFGIFLGTISTLIEAHMPESGTIAVLGVTLGAASVAGIVQAIRWAWSPILSPRIGAWSDGRRGRLPVYIGSLALAAAAFGLLPLQLPMGAWMAILLAAQLANTSIVTLTDALAADVAKAGSRVTYMTTYTTVVDIGAALGPLLGFATLGLLGIGKLYSLCFLLLALLGAAWGLYALRCRNKAQSAKL